MSERYLTLDECERLSPLIEETELPVRVTSSATTLGEDEIALMGETVEWRPRARRVLLSEQCFERYSDEELLGLLAHELGHHDGYHGLVKRVGLACVSVLETLVVSGLLMGVVGGALTGQWRLVGGCFVGILVALVLGVLGILGYSRHLEYAADRRGAALLGSTEPLQALYRTAKQDSRVPWWETLCSPSPHPADQLAVLENR